MKVDCPSKSGLSVQKWTALSQKDSHLNQSERSFEPMYLIDNPGAKKWTVL